MADPVIEMEERSDADTLAELRRVMCLGKECGNEALLLYARIVFDGWMRDEIRLIALTGGFGAADDVPNTWRKD